MDYIRRDSAQLIELEDALAGALAALQRVSQATLACRKKHGWVPTMAVMGLSRHSLQRWSDGYLYRANKLTEVLNSVHYHRR